MLFVAPVIFCFILAAIGYCDFKKGIIPNKIVYPAIIITPILNIFLADIPVMNIFLGGLIAFVFAFVLSRVAELGGGDIKFFTLIGLMFGTPLFLAVLLGGFMMGGLMVFITALRKYKGGKFLLKGTEEAPVGFYLAISGIVVNCWLMFVLL